MWLKFERLILNDTQIHSEHSMHFQHCCKFRCAADANALYIIALCIKWISETWWERVWLLNTLSTVRLYMYSTNPISDVCEPVIRFSKILFSDDKIDQMQSTKVQEYLVTQAHIHTIRRLPFNWIFLILSIKCIPHQRMEIWMNGLWFTE